MSQYTYKRELNLVCAQRLPPGRCALESHPGTRNLAPERLAKKTNAPPACQIQNRARTQPCVRPTAPPWPLPSESHPGTRNLAPERLAKTNAPPACQIQNRARIQSCVRWPNGSPRPLPSESHPGTQQSGTGSPSWRPRTSSWRASYFGSHTDAARPPPNAQVHRGRAKAPFPPQTRRRER